MPKTAPKKMHAKVLWVEGRWVSNPSFIPVLRSKGFSVDTVSNGKQALSQIKKQEPAIVVVDAASMRTSGTRICKSIRQQVNGMPILLISSPEKSVDEDIDYVNTVLTLPFTSRKLINRIIPLMPNEKDQLQKIGNIYLDKSRRQVIAHGKRTSLTPRLLRLLRMLIDHQGEIVDRETLFKKVWRTEYTGDTRTLDVHISWLREALEKNPRKPKLLKTVRGKGYILDV